MTNNQAPSEESPVIEDTTGCSGEVVARSDGSLGLHIRHVTLSNRSCLANAQTMPNMD